jgi:hypothetical protein
MPHGREEDFFNRKLQELAKYEKRIWEMNKNHDVPNS